MANAARLPTSSPSRKWIILEAGLLVPAVAVGLSLRQDKLYKAGAEVLLVPQNIANQLTGINHRRSTNRLTGGRRRRPILRAPQVARKTLELAGVNKTATNSRRSRARAPRRTRTCSSSRPGIVTLSPHGRLLAHTPKAFAGFRASSTPPRT